MIQVWLSSIDLMGTVIKVFINIVVIRKYHTSLQCIIDGGCIPWVVLIDDNILKVINIMLGGFMKRNINQGLFELHDNEPVSCMDNCFNHGSYQHHEHIHQNNRPVMLTTGSWNLHGLVGSNSDYQRG